jgi:MFS family permease
VSRLKASPTWILIIAWLGWVFDVMDAALFNFARGPMLKELLTVGQSSALYEAWFQAVFLAGSAIGGLFFGLMADRWGRGRTMIVTILIYSLTTGLMAFAPNVQVALVIRFVTGLGIGGEWAAGASLVAEVMPTKRRALGAVVLQSAAAVGPCLAALINLNVPSAHWRWLFFAGVAPALLCVAIRFLVQEPSAAERRPAVPVGVVLANPKWGRALRTALLFGVFGVVGAQILPYWLPNIVNSIASSFGDEAKKNFLSINTFTLHIGTLLGVIAFPWLADRFGRRPIFGLFFLLAPIGVWAVMLFGRTPSNLLLLLPLSTFFGIGLTSGFVLYFPELFPPEFRATGSGLAYNAGRILGILVPLLVPILVSMWGPLTAVGTLSLIFWFGLIGLFWAPETKGQPLPEHV